MATRILFFGALREQAGGGERLVEIPAGIDDATQLVDWLAGADSALKASLLSPTVRIAINQIVVDRSERFTAPDEIAFMPPFSGG